MRPPDPTPLQMNLVDRLEAIHAMFPNADVVLGSGQTEFIPATCMQRPDHQWSKAGCCRAAKPARSSTAVLTA